MSDLLTELREHDLPPRWDGLVVVWRGWEYDRSHDVFICPPPPPSVCEGCGEPTMHRGFSTRLVNIGEVAVSPFITAEQIREREEQRDRLPFLVKGKLKRLAWVRLHALRCQMCRLDLVWDMETDEWWTLDHTDYGDEGSS